MRKLPKVTDAWKFPVTAGVALVAIAVTLAWWSQVDISALFDTAEIRRGQFWRLVTCIFPHLDIMHLAFNIYWFWIFGTAIESVLGHAKTAALILLLAVSSSSIDFAFSNGGLGLSGVGYGLFAFLWVLGSRDERFAGVVDARTAKLFAIWFVLCIVATLAKIYSVANVAHAAGAATGALAGFAFALPRRRLLAEVAIAAMVLAGILGSTIGRPFVNLSKRAGYEEAKWGYDALNAGQNETAISWFKDAAKLQPKEPSIWTDLGVAYERVGNFDGASTAYQRAHDLNPEQDEYFKEFLKAHPPRR